MKLAYIPLAVILYLCWISFANYRKLSLPQADVEMDRMDHMLAEVKKQLRPSSNIGFRTNTPVGRRGVLYFKTALVLAPAVVQNADNDTMLLLEEPQFPAAFDSSYQCIIRGGNEEKRFFLVRLKR